MQNPNLLRTASLVTLLALPVAANARAVNLLESEDDAGASRDDAAPLTFDEKALEKYASMSIADLIKLELNGKPLTVHLHLEDGGNGAGIVTYTEEFPGGVIQWVDGEPPAVPLPAAAWLFLSGILGMGAIGRKRRAEKAPHKQSADCGTVSAAHMKKTFVKTAMASVLGFTALGAQAAILNAGDTLTIDDGVATFDAYGNITNVVSGSWFGMDTDANSKIAGTEKTPINGINGISIGSTQAAGDIDDWFFFGPQGQDYTTVAPTGGTTTGLDLSGWTVFWNGVNVPMGTGAWTPGNCTTLGCSGVTFTDGIATLSWDGTYGNAYSLWYSATVPAGDPSGFGGVRYLLNLVGTVNAGGEPPPIPVPGAAWLLGSGLLGLTAIARRKLGCNQ